MPVSTGEASVAVPVAAFVAAVLVAVRVALTRAGFGSGSGGFLRRAEAVAVGGVLRLPRARTTRRFFGFSGPAAPKSETP